MRRLVSTEHTQTGGSNVALQSDSGTLVLTGPLQQIGTLPSGRSFNFFGAGDMLVTGPILYSSVAPISVGKFGSGTLALNGANSYSNVTTITGGTLAINGSIGAGSVTVSSGTLSGTGTVSGTVVVLSGGTVSPGNCAIESLTINNSLANAGTLSMKPNKSGLTQTNDTLQGLGQLARGGTLQLSAAGDPLTVGDSFRLFYATSYVRQFSAIVPPAPGPGLAWNTNDIVRGLTGVTYGGPLNLTNLEGTLTAADSFKLFNASGYAGAFAALSPPTPGIGLVWNTNALASDGTLRIGLAQPAINGVTYDGADLAFFATNGLPSASYSILATTNVALPLPDWLPVTDGFFDTNGSFTCTNAVEPTSPRQFFILRQP